MFSPAQYVERLKTKYVQALLSIAVLGLFLVHASELYKVGFIEQMENIAYDARLLLTMPRTVDDRIVIVDIDEKSITAEGRFPWGRDKLETLVEQLFAEYKVGLVGFDIVFAETDTSSGLPVLEELGGKELQGNAAFLSTLESLRPVLDYDARFAQALAKYPVVLGYSFNFNDPDAGKIAAIPPPTFVKGFFKGQRVAFLSATGFTGNLQSFVSVTGSGGHFIVQPDRDGVLRRVPMLVEYDGAYYAALSLEIFRRVVGTKDVAPRFEKAAFGSRTFLEGLQVGSRDIPVDRNVQTLVPFRGEERSFPYVSATDVIRGAADRAVLEGRIVLVGTTAPGLLDLRSTPVGRVYPGVEAHANLISGMLDGRLKAAPEYALGAEVTLLVLFGLLTALVAPVMNPFGQTALAGTLVAGYVGLNMMFWSAANTVFPVASGIMMLALMFLVNMSYGYFVETRGKRQLTGLFGSYVPPELVDEMAKHPDHYTLEPDSRELTVLFSDVRGFTTLSEGLAPKDLADLMNQYLSPMTRVIHDHRGTIDKYMGDAIMAFWGAPVQDPEHARHAVQSGLEMLARLKELNQQFRTRGWPELRIGIGISSGQVSVGNLGSEFRIAYTVVGDAVNLGSRLEGLTKGYGVSLLISENTREAVPEYACREIDRVRVKGRDRPVTIYEPLCLREDLDSSWKDEIKVYKQALKYYREQAWDLAELQFLNLCKTSRAPAPYQVYAERIAYFRKNPPPLGWDGVFTHTEK